MNDPDREYLATPAEAGHEHTDIDPAIAGRFALWLTVAMLISVGIVYGAFWLFEGQTQEATRAAQTFGWAAGRLREPQGPRLQTQPFKDVYLLRQREHERLTTYGWVDQASGVVRIPIDEAMRLVAERGAVKSAPALPPGLDQVVQDSASGRTVAGR